MMTPRLAGALLLALLCVVQVHGVINNVTVEWQEASGAQVWQGMDFDWQRRVAGFETPHRIGSIASLLHNLPSSSNDSSTAQATVELVPGVDGDYAFPQVFLSAFQGNGITVHTGTLRSTCTDHWEGTDDNPDSFLKQFDFFTTPVRGPQVAWINGFSIQQYCDPSKQPPGKECNSNGTWPYLFTMRVDCNPEGTCELEWVQFRGWTPSKGGGKPYNYVLDYTYEVEIVVVSGPSLVQQQDVNNLVHSNVHADVSCNQQSARVPDNTASLVGVAAFSFELNGTHKRRGRYLEHLHFSVQQHSAKGNQNMLDWVGCMQYGAPKTVYSSDVTLAMVQRVASFDAADVQMPAQVSQAINGTVCDSGNDALFKCSDVGLENAPSDTVTHTIEW